MISHNISAHYTDLPPNQLSSIVSLQRALLSRCETMLRENNFKRRHRAIILAMTSLNRRFLKRLLASSTELKASKSATIRIKTKERRTASEHAEGAQGYII